MQELDLLRLMALSREGDKREGLYFREGLARFQLPGAGHETLAAAAQHLRTGDFLFPHYRDRALLLALGVSNYDLALAYFAKATSSCGGRQLASHFSDRAHNIMSYGSPTGMQCLPAAGVAWANKLRRNSAIVVCCLGDATSRQGEFFEALCFALQERLPLIFIIEDNGYGISTPSVGMTPLSIRALNLDCVMEINARDIRCVDLAFSNAVERARAGYGPTILWAFLDRLWSHTSSDDQRVYRSVAELETIAARDPIETLSRELIDAGILSEGQWRDTLSQIRDQVDEDYQRALRADDPDPSKAAEASFSMSAPRAYQARLERGAQVTLLQAMNDTLNHLLTTCDEVLLFGQDIEDPKGGVFGLTKGLSTKHPGKVFNSPLAEATIAGVGCGLSVAGLRPIIELQFIDFVGPAFNQLVNQIATLRWRTAGQWTCPMTILAPCGGYLPCGGPWHSQTNEAWFAHAPGLQIVMPGTPEDAAALLQAAVLGDDPVLFLLPKSLFRAATIVAEVQPVSIGQAAVRKAGIDVTLVAWGNTVRIAMEAAAAASRDDVDVEVIDLRSLVPCDWGTIRTSVNKTGRIVIVQEDARSSSFGEHIITELMRDPKVWDMMYSPPQLVSRPDVHVGFNECLERAVLPNLRDVLTAIKVTVEH